jgi:hypothetical protein
MRATVIASAAKQSISSNKGNLDCFVASLTCTNASLLLQAMTDDCVIALFPKEETK